MFNVESYQPSHGPFPACSHIRLFGPTRIAPEPQLLPKHIRQHARRLRWRVQRGCGQRFGRCGFRRHGYFTGNRNLPLSIKQLTSNRNMKLQPIAPRSLGSL